MNEDPNSKKRLSLKPLFVVGGICIVLCSIGAYLYVTILSHRETPIRVGELSPRAHEFIASQNQDGDSLFQQFDLPATPSATSIPDSDGRVETECFTLRLPWKLTQPQTEITADRCTFRARSGAPLAHVVIALYDSPAFEADTGIRLRRQQPELYQEITLESAPYPAVIFQTDQQVILFAQVKHKMLTVALNDLATGINIPNSTWLEILQSLQVTASSPVDPNLLR
jgi:hypothetical protein